MTRTILLLGERGRKNRVVGRRENKSSGTIAIKREGGRNFPCDFLLLSGIVPLV